MTPSQLTSVLHVEDSPTDALLTREEIEGHPEFCLTQVDRLGEALRVISTEQYAVVLLDLGLPDSQGLETLTRIQREAPHIPVVVMTGRDDEEIALQALQKGAQDYLVKGQTRDHFLTKTLRYAIERNLTKQALRDSEELFRGAFEHTHVAMVLTDLSHRFLRVNTAFAEMFGYSVNEMLQMSMQDITHPHDLAASLAGREKLISGASQFFQMEKRYIHKDGHVLWGLANVSITRDAHGQPMLYVGQVQDFNERKRAEDSLKLFRTLIDHSNDAIEVIDPTIGRYLDMNQKGCDDLQYSREEILRLSVVDIDQSAAKYGWDKSLELIRQTNSLVLETEHRRKDGSIFPVEINSKLVQLDREYLVSVVRDISERKKSEEALYQSEERFRQAQKMDAIGQLAGGVAHDFNNLLTIISGYSEILLSTLEVQDRRRESVKAISEAGERAASLTRQLLAFSRKTVLEPSVLDLNEVVRETGKLLRRLIGEDILLTTVLDPTISRVMVDPNQLGQVLMNLAVNARDAMPKGGKLTVETRNVELDQDYSRLHPDAQPGRYVLLSMSDTGCGMSAEVKARIFEPFFTTKGIGKGTGLGLAVVLGIVKQSGGHMEFYSEPDLGTTFKVYLPAVEGKLSASKEIDTGFVGRGTETILVVEDEDGVRGLAALVLRSYGYIVLAAANGKEAKRIVEKHRGGIDLMLTDVVMPGMSGPDLAATLWPLLPEMKVLFSSGYTDDAVIRHGLLQEKVTFLPKPYSPLSLVRKVRQVLDKK